jgi:hypothetical protein
MVGKNRRQKMNFKNKVEEKWLVVKDNLAKRHAEIERSKAELKERLAILRESWKKETAKKFDAYFCALMEALEKFFSHFQGVEEDEIKLNYLVEEEPLLANENGVQ